MSFFRLFLATLLVFVQLPSLSLAAASDGPSVVPAETLHAVTGGVCTSCSSSDSKSSAGGGGGGGGRSPEKQGQPYWELTSTRLLSHTDPGGSLVYQTQNRSSKPVNVEFTFTRREAFSWSGGGGVPANILTASFGRQYETTNRVNLSTSVPARSQLKFYTSNPTSRYSHSFSRYQDWTDGSRQLLSSGSATTSYLSTKETFVVSGL